MQSVRIVTIGLLILAALQAYAAFELLGWSIPLFGDPPMLGNSASRAAGYLRELAEQNPDGFKYIPGIDKTFLSLFHGQGKGVLLSLVAGGALAFSVAANVLFAALLFRRRRALGAE